MQNTPEIENLIKIAKILDQIKIPYYVTGGFAVSVYGHPRFTADIDIVIKMSNLAVRDFATKLQKIFPKGYVDENQISNALAEQGEFNIIDPESGLKIYFFITKNDEFEKECFKKACSQDVGYKVIFTTSENLIISKLIWHKQSQSTRHLEDIASVIDNQKKLDHKYLSLWINKLGLQAEWQKLKELKK